jgi:hypothetical protein
VKTVQQLLDKADNGNWAESEFVAELAEALRRSVRCVNRIHRVVDSSLVDKNDAPRLVTALHEIRATVIK